MEGVIRVKWRSYPLLRDLGRGTGWWQGRIKERKGSFKENLAASSIALASWPTWDLWKARVSLGKDPKHQGGRIIKVSLWELICLVLRMGRWVATKPLRLCTKWNMAERSVQWVHYPGGAPRSNPAVIAQPALGALFGVCLFAATSFLAKPRKDWFCFSLSVLF